jgi:orotate phosphoribosyltransferase
MRANPGSVVDPFLDSLWDRGLILIGDRVRQEYALNTPIFIDLRHKLYDDLDLLDAIGAALAHKIAALTADASAPQQVIGIPDTATPLALAAASASRHGSTKLFYGQLRKEPAQYPGGRSGASSYMGVADPSREITLIDDVMASGKTKLHSIEQLSQSGLRVARILVAVDREQGGAQILESQGYPVYSLYKASRLIDYFLESGRITPAEGQSALEFLRRKQYS